LDLSDAATEGRRKLRNDEIPFLYSSPNIIASEHPRHGWGIHRKLLFGKGRYILGDLKLDGKVMLKWMLKKRSEG
jgi:hypothetical protein